MLNSWTSTLLLGLALAVGNCILALQPSGAAPAIAPNPSSPAPARDNLNNIPWWQVAVNYQVTATGNRQFQACLFGDAMSAELGNTLGEGTFNFALGGMSTTSLLIQLQRLVTANVQCSQVIIAIGTNDAWYGHEDQRFTQQLQQAIALGRKMGASQITLIPAFYATIAASQNVNLAGPLSRVDQINALMQQVATVEKVAIAADGIQALYQDRALNPDFSVDGVHLNDAGRKIYRQALLKILQPATATQSSSPTQS